MELIYLFVGGMIGALGMMLACMSGQSGEREKKMMKDARKSVKRTARRKR